MMAAARHRFPHPWAKATQHVPTAAVRPLRRLAAQYGTDSPAREVITDLLDRWQWCCGREPHTEPQELAEHVRRAGWLELLRRRDRLTLRCVREVLGTVGSSDLPFRGWQHIDPTRMPAGEWARRLEPVARTAAFEIIDHGRQATANLNDPETTAPVIRTRDGTLKAAIVRRLPATSPLAELILDLEYGNRRLNQAVWVRTESGTLYPAPRISGGGWAAQEVAGLIHLLLDDITAQPPADHFPAGLLMLTERQWPPGTVLDRDQLEVARGSQYRFPGGPWPSPPG